MTAFALTLLLIAAVLHATWNYAAKKAGSGGLPFVYLVGLIICTLYVPALFAWSYFHRVSISGGAVLWILGSGVLKTGYSLFLQRGYRTGDFSLIYPLARGTGPLLSTVAAVLLLGERPGPLTLLGGAIIVASIFWLTGGFAAVVKTLRNLGAGSSAPGGSQVSTAGAAPPSYSVGYGIMSGVFIAAYTVWDRRGVASLAIAPILYDGGTAFTQLFLLTPFALRRRHEVAEAWRKYKQQAFVMATLSPLGYILVLTALSVTPVSTIAPAREISIVIGAFIGVRVLKEADGRRRLTAAACMVVGIVLLSLAK